MIDFEILLKQAETHLNNRLPVVFFRKPDDTFLQVVRQDDDALIHVETFKDQGFVFAPFDNQSPTVLIKGVIESVEIPELHWKPSRKKKDTIQHFYQPDDVAMLDYIRKIKKIKALIEDGKVEKIVLSREEFVPLNKFNIIDVFVSLLSAYPTAFVYGFYHPKVGTWLGATPENFLSVRDTRFMTVSLAGTKQFLKNQYVTWGEKEKHEQQLVTDFICKQLKPYTAKLTSTAASSFQAGNLFHLRSEITGNLLSTDIHKAISLLHPTPATCGLPRETAKEFILENEGYSRDYYTGFLGPVYSENRTDLYVNLRCMKIVDNQARIFVGGGITRNSIPEEEWKETMAKAETMKRILYVLSAFS
ncbi:MAG: isochorismate synthase [Flavobacteriales bacterium CG_4_9_14_3_um_filter_40_17]|nr:MAG: isochorismate synthase [Flavobacteriales bacterium CG_4_9_14_3_um_filter_40_17]